MSAGFELPAKDAKKYENTLDFFRISSVFRGHDCLNLTDRQTGFISFENEKIISARSMAFHLENCHNIRFGGVLRLSGIIREKIKGFDLNVSKLFFRFRR